MPDENTPNTPAAPEPSLGGISADELLARGMQSVKMTGGNTLGSWQPPSVTEVATLFPGYEILEIIGRGGMGAVYRAKQLALDRIVAIKLLPLEVSIDREFSERFKREARTMAKLNHPNIVSVFDFGTTSEGHLFFVMEFVEGTTLHQMIRTVGMKPGETLEIVVAVCEALQYAHTEGIVHRDIKPANVLVDVRGRVKVTDFGLARLSTPSADQMGYTMTGAVLGTPDYMAPEQKRGAHVDHRADIYSLGVMLYEMLCGQVPQGVFDPPSMRVGVDTRIDEIVIRAMQQEPNRRYANTGEMKTDVQTIRMSTDSKAIAPVPRVLPGAPGQASSPATRKSPVPAVIAGVVVVGAAVWFGKDFVSKPDAASTPAPQPIAAATPVAAPVVIPATPAPVVAAPVPPAATPMPVAVAAPPPPVPNTPQVPLAAVTTPPVPITTAVVAQTPANMYKLLIAEGDALLRARERENAITSYNKAIDLAVANSKAISPIEAARLAKKVAELEQQFGSPAMARVSLDRARAMIRGKVSGADASKLLDEIEAMLTRVKRDE